MIFTLTLVAKDLLGKGQTSYRNGTFSLSSELLRCLLQAGQVVPLLSKFRKIFADYDLILEIQQLQA